jgi:hypothetical protein
MALLKSAGTYSRRKEYGILVNSGAGVLFLMALLLSEFGLLGRRAGILFVNPNFCEGVAWLTPLLSSYFFQCSQPFLSSEGVILKSSSAVIIPHS